MLALAGRSPFAKNPSASKALATTNHPLGGALAKAFASTKFFGARAISLGAIFPTSRAPTPQIREGRRRAISVDLLSWNQPNSQLSLEAFRILRWGGTVRAP